MVKGKVSKKNVSKKTSKEISQEAPESLENEVLVENERNQQVLKNMQASLDKIEEQILKGYQTFEYEEKEYRIIFPKNREKQMINKFKSKVTTRLLKDPEIKLEEELIEELIKRNLWSKEKQHSEDKFQESIGLVLQQIMTENAQPEPNKKRLADLQKERLRLQIDSGVLTRTKNELLSSSFERLLEEELNRYKAVICLKKVIRHDEDNVQVEPLWVDMEAVRNEEDEFFFNKIMTEALMYWAGLNQSMFDLAPDSGASDELNLDYLDSEDLDNSTTQDNKSE